MSEQTTLTSPVSPTFESEVRASTSESTEFFFDVADNDVEFTHPNLVSEPIKTDIEMFVGAIYEEPAGWLNSSVQLLFIYPERLFREQIRYYFKDSEVARSVADQLNTIAADFGVAADVFVQTTSSQIIGRRGQMFHASHTDFSKKWKGTTEYRTSDVESVRRRRSAVDVILKSGKMIRGWPAYDEPNERLVTYLSQAIHALETSTPQQSAEGWVTELERLGSLYERGLITEEEYASAKQKLLG